MSKLRKEIQRFSVPLFFILAYAYSWTCWLLANRILEVYRDDLQGVDSILIASAVPLAIRVGFIPLALTATFGPALSAILLTAAISGKAGLREFFSRVVKWRVGIRFYLAVTLLPLAIHLLPYGIAVLLGGELPTFASVSLLTGFGIFFNNFFRSGGQEELGFRGFAQPGLRQKFGPISTSLIIGVLWFFWHLPLYVWIPSASQYGSSLILGLTAQVAVTFLFTWVYDSTESILMAMLLHASINTFGVILSAAIPHPSGTLIFWLTRIVAYSIIGILLILSSRSGVRSTPTSSSTVEANGN